MPYVWGMSRSYALALCLALFALVACRRDPAPEPAPAVATASSSLSATETTHPGTFENLPDVRHRGWWILQVPHGDAETQVQVWAPGEHLKEAFTFWVPDLFREHHHFAEWSHGSLFAIRRIGSTDGDAWTDELWEYRDGQDPRRVAAGKGLDFRVSPNGQRIAVVFSAPESSTSDVAQVLDRNGKMLAQKRAGDFGQEAFDVVDLGDSLLYLGAGIDQDLFRWSLASDSLVPVAIANPDVSVDDRLVVADRDLLVASDLPRIHDVEGQEEFIKARTPVVLRAFHLRDGRELELARAVGRGFHPVLVENDSIEIDTSTPDSTVCIAPPWP